MARETQKHQGPSSGGGGLGLSPSEEDTGVSESSTENNHSQSETQRFWESRAGTQASQLAPRTALREA